MNRSRVLVLAVGLVMLALVATQLSRRHPAPAPPLAVPTGRATVAIFDDGAPLADRWVVFHDADGSVLATMKSGADGKAASDIHAGGMITVAYGTSIHQLFTVVGVEPGDEVVIGEHDNDEGEAGNTVALARIVLPGTYPSSARYCANLGVGNIDFSNASTPLRMPILRRFVDGAHTFPVLGLAVDARGDSLAFAFASIPSGERDGGDAEARLPAWSTDWREQRLVLARAPAGLTTAKADLALLVGESRFDHGVGVTPVSPTSDTTLRFSVPRPLGATASYRVELGYGTTPGADRAVLVRRAAAMPADVRLDLGEALLPRVSAANVEASRDRARPIVRWTTTGNAATADAAIVQLTWPVTKEHVWTIIAPPTTEPRFQVPALPAELAEWKPDARSIRPAVALVEASAYASYADVRKKWIHLLGETPEEDATLRLSMTGDLDF